MIREVEKLQDEKRAELDRLYAQLKAAADELAALLFPVGGG